MNDYIDRKAALDALGERPVVWSDNDDYTLGERNQYDMDRLAIETVPSAQPEWNNHTVACLIAELFGDTCACNFNDIRDWLPEKCELLDSCPSPGGVACWEQFLKHKAEEGEE